MAETFRCHLCVRTYAHESRLKNCAICGEACCEYCVSDVPLFPDAADNGADPVHLYIDVQLLVCKECLEAGRAIGTWTRDTSLLEGIRVHVKLHEDWLVDMIAMWRGISERRRKRKKRTKKQ